jgi:hypothetical protein
VFPISHPVPRTRSWVAMNMIVSTLESEKSRQAKEAEQSPRKFVIFFLLVCCRKIGGYSRVTCRGCSG